MNAVELPFATWRVVIDALRAKGLPYMFAHADHLERQLDQHPPGPVVRLSLTDDVSLRSYTWARVQLGIPLPPPEQEGPTAPRR
jgi:hypothetical protein